ncbi:DNA primase [Pseudomonas phage Kara-mokiny_kep-wari_Wadjak_3]|nr:DNA primase [Pseudomonas phage Kara-mokiny_kep-wari_Wadjak_3]UXD82452.1 DNA primase [Pseudomonas phage Kara-mokiny kep-wari Wadjak 10]
MKPHEIRLAQAEEFLRELGRGIPDDERVMVGYAEEATVQTDENGRKLNAGWWPVPWKEGKYINSRSNAYACISSSIKTPNPKTGQMRYWRGEASFGHGLALMVDDIGSGKGSKGDFDRDEFRERLEPTAIVETSPNNYQFWYFFKEPMSHMLQFKALLYSFVDQVLKKGGDNTVKDVSRYGRMPFGFNNKRGKDGKFKYADENGKPELVRLYSADYSKRYSPEEIAQAFGVRIIMPQMKKVEINRDDWVYDQVWLKYAEHICTKYKMGEATGGQVQQNMSGKYRIRCPWGDEHTNGDPFGAYFRGPIPGAEHEYVFGCGHDTCRKEHRRTWAAFTDEVVLPYIVEQLERINRRHIGEE